MVKSCSVWGCSARFRKGTGLSFFKFPDPVKKASQRDKWILKLNRVTDNGSSSKSVHGCISLSNGKPWQPGKWDLVCGRHFITGTVMDT